MSLKTKLTSLITTFLLLCSLLTVGVFAVKNTTFNVGGDIVFNVQGIEADIELTANGVQNAEFNNDEVIGQDVLSKIQIRNNTSADSIASQFAKWSNLDMTFAEGQTTATIEFKITNMASEEDNYIDITALADATTKDNAKIIVRNNEGGVTALLKSGEDATFTITFEVKDDEYKASLNGFSVNFDMQKKVLADFPVLSEDMTYETLRFQLNSDNKTLNVRDIGWNLEDDVVEKFISSGDLVIPAYVNNDGTVYAVTEIVGYAFGDDGDMFGVDSASLTSVSIPRTIKEIGYDAFHFCELTGDLFIPSSVTTIGSMAFTGTTISSVTFEYGIEIECLEGFDSIDSLTSLEIPDSVITIGEYAFAFTGLTSISIPEGVENIDMGAFCLCHNLTSVTIPKSLTKIGSNNDDVFGGCENLKIINYRGTKEQWNSIEGIVYEDFPDDIQINYNYTGV